MIDLSEELIPLGDVPRLPFVPRRRRGRKLNVATVHRWAWPGVRGVRLEIVSVGGTRCTTRGALLAFFRALAPASDSPLSSPRTTAQRQRAGDRAAAELQAAGV